MRKLLDHVTSPADAQLTVLVLDEPGAGGAHHSYAVFGMDTNRNASLNAIHDNRQQIAEALGKTGLNGPTECDEILFQNGAVPENGVNGITENVLMAIVIDRLRCFQAGPFACHENAQALVNLEQALHWNQQRTLRRVRQGIEGQHREVTNAPTGTDENAL